MSWEEISDENIFDGLVEAIQKAETQAIKEGIENNTVIINSDLDKSNPFYIAFLGSVRRIPPMILGKNIVFQPLPQKYMFALTETNVENPYDRIHELEDLIRKYVVVSGETSLKFKNALLKKNESDFRKFKEIIND